MTLELKHLTKTFAEKKAVDNLSFQVAPGEILGLIGQNGAGKTTTFRLILQFLQPTQGEILWNGQSAAKIQANDIGYLPEERGLYGNVTIEEQLLFFAELKGCSRKETKAKIDQWLERAEVVGKKTDLIKTLSKGNQQKIQLISTIIHEPKLIILDEPFSGLDPVNSEILKQFVFEMKAQGAAIIFSSHRMENVEELCDSLIMLKKGQTVLKGTTEAVKLSYGRKRIRLVAPHLSDQELSSLTGVESLTRRSDGVRIIQLEDEKFAESIFSFVTKDGFIPMFSLEPPTLEEIFKWKAGEADE
ncbi:ABC transporter ATP-binding protein [Listeria costaricensis]|uniref:ABC transporter ATP-binding protein n=1 Tax=Listeria costaricensis TaxID=2026604 RepID=UPI000C085E78|nr:ABC transporter ATP-binding protein [Listeria costaricensis]